MFWRNNARSCSRTSKTWRIHAGVRTSTRSGNAGEKVKILIKWSFPAWGELDELMCWLNYMQQNTTEKLESRRVKHVTSSSERRRRHRRHVCSIKLTETSLHIIIYFIYSCFPPGFYRCVFDLFSGYISSSQLFSVQQRFNASDCTQTRTITGFLII